ncbi:CcmD family protein [Spirosoma gilvum]
MLNLTETLRSDGKLWVVITVIFIVLLGWLYYLVRTGHRVHKLRRKTETRLENRL